MKTLQPIKNSYGNLMAELNLKTSWRLESLLFKLEILDHKTRERAGVITPLGSPVPVLLQLDAAAEALESQNTSYGVIQSLYNYWKAKRDRWQKPILRRLQPPPPVNDTNPYNVFRPREKAHRHHTRRMQRRENNLQSFEKLCQVRRNFNQAKALLEALIKREEKKREVMECEVNLQRIQIKYRHQSQLFEDGLALSGFPSFSHRKESSEDYSKNFPNGYTPNRNAVVRKSHGADSMQMIGRTKREPRRPLLRGCFQRVDPHEPVLLFAKPIDQEKLAAAGIKKPSEPPNVNGETIPRYRLQGRIGRGGRIIFDRLNPISRNPVIDEMSLLPAPCPQHPPPG
ncbi:hypothetical protein AMTR_s00061p00039240 [Amborella trichopoda]|uniref:Enhancer of polycomb-like protein n=1 Tax=Amborella trichopoda TaxID=13333 RepID=U5DF14_AMBTC|nr:hypothetical protein AMTR_s00061p00039240 [Amborella trichopoda]